MSDEQCRIGNQARRVRKTAGRLLLAVLMLTGAACGDGETLTVDEARSASGRHSVTGALVARDDVVNLCQALAESFPPQCGVASIEVNGLDFSTIPDLRTESGVSWTDRPVTLTGVLESGVLTVDRPET